MLGLGLETKICRFDLGVQDLGLAPKALAPAWLYWPCTLFLLALFRLVSGKLVQTVCIVIEHKPYKKYVRL